MSSFSCIKGMMSPKCAMHGSVTEHQSEEEEIGIGFAFLGWEIFLSVVVWLDRDAYTV